MKNIKSTKRMARTFDSCPFCGKEHTHIIKWGKEHGHQRYKCCDCGKTFCSRTNTIFSSSKLGPRKLRLIVDMLNADARLKIITLVVNVSLQTVLFWRRKVEFVKNSVEKPILKGNIETDEMYFSIDGNQITQKKSGLSNNLLWTSVTVDDSNHVIIEKGDQGYAHPNRIKEKLNKRIEPGSVITHDMKKYGTIFGDLECYEITVDKKNYSALNRVNRTCSRIRRKTMVHLGIRRDRLQWYFNEIAYDINNADKGKEQFYCDALLCGQNIIRKEIYPPKAHKSQQKDLLTT